MTAFSAPVKVMQSQVALSGGGSDLRFVLTPPSLRAYDPYFGGAGRIGPFTVKVDSDPADLPLRRLVRLYRDRDGIFIRATWSDAATGVYQFDWVDPRERYTAIAYDYEHDYRAVVADNLAPTLIA